MLTANRTGRVAFSCELPVELRQAGEFAPPAFCRRFADALACLENAAAEAALGGSLLRASLLAFARRGFVFFPARAAS
jgi:hypothetical protein